ncbi:hypothetical protein [Streptomyces sp. NPDC052811]|uniref:hypothetical protein n=1 Tax=Streptomyces sp. NPDC052811 TaxID=3155731 RepID=UPI0034461A19
MTYVPTAVAVGYLSQPEMDLPMPGPAFARRITTLLETAAHRPAHSRCLPARPAPKERTLREGEAAPRLSSVQPTEPARPQLGDGLETVSEAWGLAGW